MASIWGGKKKGKILWTLLEGMTVYLVHVKANAVGIDRSSA